MQPYSCFIGLLAVMAAMSAHGEIPSDPTRVHPLSVGTRWPMFEGVTADGKLRCFPPKGFHRPTTDIRFLGGCSPYCHLQLLAPPLLYPTLPSHTLHTLT